MAEKEVNRITFVVIAVASLFSIMSHLELIATRIKEECISMYLNGMGFRAIERVKGVHHTTIISWVKQLGKNLPDTPPIEEIPEVGELDELETFVGSKKNKIWR